MSPGEQVTCRQPWVGWFIMIALGFTLFPLVFSWAQTRQPADKPPELGGMSSGDMAFLQTGPAGELGGMPSPPTTPAGGPSGPAGGFGMFRVLPKAEMIKEAEEEVEIQKAQLAAKKSEVVEARVFLEHGKRNLVLRQRLFESKGTSIEDMDKAHLEVLVAEARLQGKEAQLREADLRLKRAERHLAHAKRVPRPQPGSGATTILPPGMMSSVPITMGSSGGRTGSYTGTSSVGSSAPNLEHRLGELEKKVEKLFKELEKVRR